MSDVSGAPVAERRRFTAPPAPTVSATDPDETIQVTLDQAGRISLAQVLHADDVRAPESLDAAVADAYREAVSRQREELRAGRPRETNPVPRNRRQPIERIDNWMDQGWRPDPAAVQPTEVSFRDIGELTGVSDNECVEVRLGIASSFGTLTTDAGWLANATAAQIGAAVTQAFAAAYRKRDLP